jgi:hypothetical protein
MSAAAAVCNSLSMSVAAAVDNSFSAVYQQQLQYMVHSPYQQQLQSITCFLYQQQLQYITHSTYITDSCIMYWNTLSTVYHQQLLQYVYNLIYVFAAAKVYNSLYESVAPQYTTRSPVNSRRMSSTFIPGSKITFATRKIHQMSANISDTAARISPPNVFPEAFNWI